MKKRNDREMKKIIIKKNQSNKFTKGYPLVQRKDLVEPMTTEHDDQLVMFVNEDHTFLSYGYASEQNKGIGWMLSFNQAEPITDSWLMKQLRYAIERRESFFKDDLTTAFRLVNGEGDGLGGMTLDWYDGFLVISWYNRGIIKQKSRIVKAILQLLPETKGVYEKIRFKSEEYNYESAFISGQEAPEPLLVVENGVTYATYMNEGLMTGIFLDQKEVRGRLTEGLAAGKSLLNMFSYTGAFSSAALMGGASHTTSVDLAKRSREKTEEQFNVNGFDTESQDIIVMDVFDYFRYAKRKEKSYDVIVLDPPSFARNKKKTFSVVKDYEQLVSDACDILNPEGYLIASTNAANLSYDKFVEMVEAGIKKKNKHFKAVDHFRLPKDFVVSPQFKEGNYLKVLLYKID